MKIKPVIAIFDIGKTNKKLFLFDESYNIVYRKSTSFAETVDDDGFHCENIHCLTLYIFDALKEVLNMRKFMIIAINFSAYGASFVHVDENATVITPLYNYLKQYPPALKKQFYETYGGEAKIASETSSPVLGNLNSGMQLYHLKYQKPYLYKKIKYSLHLPQYLSFLITGIPVTELTSIGCHTGLWDFVKNDYHEWVYREGISEKFPPIKAAENVIEINLGPNKYVVGTGLHDSSAALIPYLVNFTAPFILISTGTWCISFNPSNNSPLTDKELLNDCLCYIDYQGTPIKASRLFAGNEHEQQVKKIAEHFNVNTAVFKNIGYKINVINALNSNPGIEAKIVSQHQCSFSCRDLNIFRNYTEAYHQLMRDIMDQQIKSTSIILNGPDTRRIFVDGGFSKNSIYMNLLASAFPHMEVFAASMAQATSVGAAIAIHRSWNKKPLPADIMALKYYSTPHPVSL